VVQPSFVEDEDMTWETWLLYAATDAFAYLVPGPAALFIVSQALARGAGRTSWAILGVLSAEVMYFILSATGLALLLTASYDLFFAIKWLGAAYLVWLGILAFRGRAGAFAVDPARRPISPLRSALHGFVMNAANPKVLLFYTAIVPQFVNPHVPIVPQMLLLDGPQRRRGDLRRLCRDGDAHGPAPGSTAICQAHEPDHRLAADCGGGGNGGAAAELSGPMRAVARIPALALIVWTAW
jgi:homoserine/homoserine lactone efflux protein